MLEIAFRLPASIEGEMVQDNRLVKANLLSDFGGFFQITEGKLGEERRAGCWKIGKGQAG